MPNIPLLRQQHQAAMELAGSLIDQIERYSEGDDAFRLSLTLARLVAVLRLHLAHEDDRLYPLLHQSDDADARRMALEFSAEMGGLAQSLEDYLSRWGTSAAIAAAFDRFRDETMRVLHLLSVRVRREEDELYPRAEQVLAGTARNAA